MSAHESGSIQYNLTSPLAKRCGPEIEIVPSPTKEIERMKMDALDSCWPSGLALVQIYLFGKWLPSTGEAHEMQQYIGLGSIFVGAVWAIERGRKLHGVGRVLWNIVRTSLVAGLFAAAVMWELPLSRSVKIVVTAVAGGVLGIVLCRRLRPGIVGHLLTWSIFSICATRLIFWDLRETWPRLWYQAWPAAASCLLAMWALCRKAESTQHARSYIWRHAFAACCLCFMSSRAWPHDISQHWAWIAGPAHLVRQGGHLLWDTPAQYGFLSTLFVSWLPTKSVWYSLYVANAVCGLIYSLVVYAAFARLRQTLAMAWTALFIAGAATFLLTGWSHELTGPQIYPSVGGFRFVWLALLVGVAHVPRPVQIKSRHDGDDTMWRFYNRQRFNLSIRVGTLVWCLGCLWSAESFVWCSITWLPSVCFLSLQRAYVMNYKVTSWYDKSKIMLTALVRQTTVGFITAGFVFGVYFVNYGHTLDALAFFDHARAYGSGFGALPVDLKGSVWGLVAVYTLAVGTCLRVSRRVGFWEFPCCALTATLALWCVSTYFVSRSHDNNVLNIAPFIALGVAAILHLANLTESISCARDPVVYAVLPIVCVILFLGYHQTPLLGRHTRQWYRGLNELQAGSFVPENLNMQQLLDQSGYKCDEPLMAAIQDGQGLMPKMWCVDSETKERRLAQLMRPWLPLLATNIIHMFSEDLRYLYVKRFLKRRIYADVWLFTPLPCDASWTPWHTFAVAEHYNKSETVIENGNLCLHHYYAKQ